MIASQTIQCNNFLHNIGFVLGIIIHLEMISGVWEDTCRWYANATFISIRDLSISRFWCLRGVLELETLSKVSNVNSNVTFKAFQDLTKPTRPNGGDSNINNS